MPQLREESSPQPLQENHIKVEVEDPSNEDSDSPDFEADEQTHSDPSEGTIHEDPATSPALTRRQRSSNQKRRKFFGNLDSASEDNDSDDEFLPDEDYEQEFGVSKKRKSDAKERLTVDKKVIHIHKCRLHLVSGDNYKCSKCDAILTNQRTISRSHVVKNHTLIHSCSQCTFTFDCKSALKRHNDLVHNKLPKIECPICARPFTRADNFKSHSWTHYSEQEKAEAVARGEKAPYSHNKSERFQCDQCSRVFYKSKALERHLKERHSNGEKQLCPLCGASVVDVKRHTMISHTAPENRRFECSMCSKRFVLNNHLQVHRKKAHSTDKPFKCEVCGKDFKFVTNLKEHQLQHSNVKPFECYVCKMAFSRKQVMKRHVASVHEGKKRSDNKKCKKQ
ncbi:putative zinc finger protein [Orchesella cincta]|uniref:Putative zinc finger protein n=1 Tax=Orchesella cincta TaxID=48709 RepID=A0A1D2MDA5_ORCCI|nr:putative zinc finger protein [Orchesella cincta]